MKKIRRFVDGGETVTTTDETTGDTTVTDTSVSDTTMANNPSDSTVVTATSSSQPLTREQIKEMISQYRDSLKDLQNPHEFRRSGDYTRDEIQNYKNYWKSLPDFHSLRKDLKRGVITSLPEIPTYNPETVYERMKREHGERQRVFAGGNKNFNEATGTATGMKKGGMVRSAVKRASPKKTSSVSKSVSSASKRGDGIAQRGKTKGKLY